MERTFRSQLQEAGFAAENKLSSVREGLEEEQNTIRKNLKDVLSKSLSRENESASRIKELEDDLELTRQTANAKEEENVELTKRAHDFEADKSAAVSEVATLRSKIEQVKATLP